MENALLYLDRLVRVKPFEYPSSVNHHFSRLPARDLRRPHLESWLQKICSRWLRSRSGSAGVRVCEEGGLSPGWWGGRNEADRRAIGTRDPQQSSEEYLDCYRKAGYESAVARAFFSLRIETF